MAKSMDQMSKPLTGLVLKTNPPSRAGTKLKVIEFAGGPRLLPLPQPSSLRGSRAVSTTIDREPDRLT